MPIYLGEMRKDIPFNRAYLGEQIVYDSAIQIDHSYLVYDGGIYGKMGTFGIKDVNDPPDFTYDDFNSTSLTEENGHLVWSATGTNRNKNGGGFATSGNVNMKSFGTLFAKMRTTAMSQNCGAFVGLFTTRSDYMNMTTAITKETFKFQVTGGTTVRVTTEKEPNVLMNFSVDARMRVGIGTYSDKYSTSGTVSEPTGLNVYSVYLFKNDNWRTLATMAGVTPTTMENLIENPEDIFISEEALNYMLTRCTGTFMINALNNATFMEKLYESDVASEVMSNVYWKKFFDIVYEPTFDYDVLPMKWADTGNNLSFTAENYLGSWALDVSRTSGNEANNAVSGINLTDKTSYASGAMSSGEQLTYTVTFPVPIKIGKLLLTYSYMGNNQPGVIQGYANGTWVDIGTIPRSLNKNAHTFNISDNTFYEKVRVLTVRWNADNPGAGIYVFAITGGEIDFIGGE